MLVDDDDERVLPIIAVPHLLIGGTVVFLSLVSTFLRDYKTTTELGVSSATTTTTAVGLTFDCLWNTRWRIFGRTRVWEICFFRRTFFFFRKKDHFFRFGFICLHAWPSTISTFSIFQGTHYKKKNPIFTLYFWLMLSSSYAKCLEDPVYRPYTFNNRSNPNDT